LIHTIIIIIIIIINHQLSVIKTYVLRFVQKGCVGYKSKQSISCM